MQLLDGPYSVASLQSFLHIIHGMAHGLTYEFKVSYALRVVYSNHHFVKNVIHEMVHGLT